MIVLSVPKGMVGIETVHIHTHARTHSDSCDSFRFKEIQIHPGDNKAFVYDLCTTRLLEGQFRACISDTTADSTVKWTKTVKCAWRRCGC